jgi:molybdate transport system ATP-binding protein
MSAQIELRFDIPLRDFRLSVDTRIPAKGLTVLFGPSGCGKTTLLRLIAGLHRAPAGFLKIQDEIWQDAKTFRSPHQRRVGYVFQDANLFPHLSVRGNLEYGWKRLPPSQRPPLDPLVELLGIGTLLPRRPDTLSGGERQRVGLARALACAPRVLLMDEPLSALDRDRKREILPWIERLRAEVGIPILYVTHAPEEVYRLADHLVVLRAGNIALEGPFRDLQGRIPPSLGLGEDPGTVLDATIGEVDGIWQLARADFPGGSLWARDRGLPVGQATRLLVLARDVSLAREAPGHTSIQNVLQGTVETIEPDEHPGLALVRVRVGTSAILARLTRRSVADLSLAPGQAVWAQVKTVALADG